MMIFVERLTAEHKPLTSVVATHMGAGHDGGARPTYCSYYAKLPRIPES